MTALPLADARQRAAFRRSLLAWFRQSARDLPWRRTRDPYRVWISEILLQQTRVETVQRYYERFVAALPTVQALAAASLDRVLKLWEGLGYYARARHLRAAGKIIVGAPDGRMPRRAAEWQRLPGVGPYTAAAIASITQGEAVPAVDGNVKRILARLYRIAASIDQDRTRRRLAALAAGLLAPAAPGDFNQAMMELGARICKPRRPSCPACPVQRWCAAAAAGIQDRLPARRRRRPVPCVDEVAGLVEKNGRWLLVQRPPTGLLGGLWELPGGAVGPGEAPMAALVARLRESWGIGVRVQEPLGAIAHAYSHRALRLHVYRCRPGTGELRALAAGRARWVRSGQLTRYALTRATQKVLARLGADDPRLHG